METNGPFPVKILLVRQSQIISKLQVLYVKQGLSEDHAREKARDEVRDCLVPTLTPQEID